MNSSFRQFKANVAKAAVLLSVFWLSMSCNLLGVFEDLLDGQSSEDQGLPILNADNIEAISPEDGASFFFLPQLLSTNVLGAEAYHFQIASDDLFSNIVHERDDIGENQYQVDDIAELTGYWRVRARKNGIWGSWSGAKSITFSSGIIDINPGLETTTSDLTPLLTWNIVAQASSYVIRFSTTASSLEQEQSQNTVLPQYTVPTAVAMGDTLFWQVRVISVGNTAVAWSKVFSFNVNVGIPGSPNPNNASKTSDSTPLLSWEGVPDINRYEVRYSDALSTLPSRVAIATSANEYQISSNYALGKTIYWQARSVNDDGITGSWSEVWSVEIAYQVGEAGPAGGIVFYDKGSYSSGWRFMEVSPVNVSTNAVWGGYGTSVPGTSSGIGTGKANTAIIVAAFGSSEEYAGRSDYAARLADNFVYGGYNDWFLPSVNELAEVIAQKDVVGLTQGWWWSSTQGDAYEAWYWRWWPTDPHLTKKSEARVRAIRSF